MISGVRLLILFLLELMFSNGNMLRTTDPIKVAIVHGLDDIIFPSTGEQIGIPVFVIDMEDINFGEVIVNTIVSQTVTICNCGTASMLGTIATESPFSLGEPSMPAYYLEYIIPVVNPLLLM